MTTRTAGRVACATSCGTVNVSGATVTFARALETRSWRLSFWFVSIMCEWSSVQNLKPPKSFHSTYSCVIRMSPTTGVGIDVSTLRT